VTVVTFYGWFLSYFDHNDIYHFLKISTYLFMISLQFLYSIAFKYIPSMSSHVSIIEPFYQNTIYKMRFKLQ